MKKTKPDEPPALRRASPAATVGTGAGNFTGERHASPDAAADPGACSLETAMLRRDEMIEEAFGRLRVAVRDIAEAVDAVLGGMAARQRAPAGLEGRHGASHARFPTVAGSLNEITVQLRQLEVGVRAAQGSRGRRSRDTP